MASTTTNLGLTTWASSDKVNFEQMNSNFTTIDAKIGEMADYVVEQGTSDEWVYRKWNSGVFEGWVVHPGWVCMPNGTYTSFTFPNSISLTDTSYAVMMGRGSNPVTNFYQPDNFDYCNFCTTNHSLTSFTACCWNSSTATTTVTLFMHVLGKWK